MTLGQMRLYLAAHERRRRAALLDQLTVARSVWMQPADAKKLVDALKD